jgi:hypothetical protein
MNQSCILCQSKCVIFFQDTKYGKDYFCCSTCDLKFLDPAQRLTPEDENSRYLIHENNPTDIGYQNYLQPVRDVISEKLNLKNYPTGRARIQLLDFGSGAHSALVPLFAQLPIDYYAFDPYFKNDLNLLDRQYDVIVMTEVIEHLREPSHVLNQLKKITFSNGHIIVMTQFFSEKTDFKNWHYRRDPTHIAFFSKKTMSHIKEQLGFSEVEFFHDRVACFKI